MAASSYVDPSAVATMSSERMHRALDAFNRWRLSPATPTDDWALREAAESEHRALEIRFVDAERAAVRARAAAAPTEAGAFVAWFEELEAVGPGQHDRLFDWLEAQATVDDLRWFLRQEIAGEAGFDDLVALTQLKMPALVKLELGRNYWDELGQGHEKGMHGPMLARLATELGLSPAGGPPIVWESLALANLMTACAAHRRYAYQSIGALGVIELTAPGRAKKVNEALRRVGVDGEARGYFALHATLDVKHSAAWNKEVLSPLVASDGRLARPIAEGALMRLAAGARCFERYRAALNVA